MRTLGPRFEMKRVRLGAPGALVDDFVEDIVAAAAALSSEAQFGCSQFGEHRGAHRHEGGRPARTVVQRNAMIGTKHARLQGA